MFTLPAFSRETSPLSLSTHLTVQWSSIRFFLVLQIVKMLMDAENKGWLHCRVWGNRHASAGMREWHPHSSALSQPLSTSNFPTSLATSLLTFALQVVSHAHILLLGVVFFSQAANWVHQRRGSIRASTDSSRQKYLRWAFAIGKDGLSDILRLNGRQARKGACKGRTHLVLPASPQMPSGTSVMQRGACWTHNAVGLQPCVYFCGNKHKIGCRSKKQFLLFLITLSYN